MHFMGELVLHRTQVEALAAEADVPGLSQAMQDLTRTSHALQAMVMQVRMIPVEAVFLRFPRLVRDLSTKLGKQVELELVGKDTELDRTVVDALGDPLVHLDPQLARPRPRGARRSASRPASRPTGTLELSARHAGGNVVIEVRDDGRGIDPAKVAREGRRARPDRRRRRRHDRHGASAVELLFHPGFSTAEVTSDISGRGVGMDAVRTTIRELGGEVLMTSELGQGTSAQIRLPLTLAIMAALLVEADGRPFAIPLDRIERTVRLADHTVRSVAGEPHARAARRRAADRRRRRALRRRRRRRRPSYAVDRARRRPARCARRRRPPCSASASSSPARFRPRSPRAPRSPAAPCCPTARSR